MSAPEPIPYASPNMATPRITFRGAITTLIVGGAFLLLALALVAIAWSIFRSLGDSPSYRVANTLEPLGIFVCVLSGLSFLCGIVIVILGLKGVRQRELD
jgi:hypothetical protein